MNSNIIRWAQLADFRDLAYVYSESYRKAYIGVIPDDFLEKVTASEKEQYFQQSLSEGKQKIAIMLVNEIAIALMIFDFQSEADLPEKSAEILAIYLLKDYWGSGFGKLFLNWGTDRIKELGYANVFLWVLKDNINAIKFYKYQDFIFDGAEREIIRGKSLSQLRFQKLLGKGL